MCGSPRNTKISSANPLQTVGDESEKKNSGRLLGTFTFNKNIYRIRSTDHIFLFFIKLKRSITETVAKMTNGQLTVNSLKFVQKTGDTRGTVAASHWFPNAFHYWWSMPHHGFVQL